MTVSFTPNSLSWSDVDNLSTSVRNLSSASNEHNIQLTAQEDGDTVVLYARDTTKTGSLYPSQQGSVSKERPELAFKATQAAFENLYEKAGLDTKQLETFFSNITEQPNRETSALKEGEILRLCTMAKAAKAAHLSQSTAQMQTERAQTLSSQPPLSLSTASKALQKEYQSHDATNTYIKDSYSSKDALNRFSINTIKGIGNAILSFFASIRASHSSDVILIVGTAKKDLETAGRKIDQNPIATAFDNLKQKNTAPTHVKSEVITLHALKIGDTTETKEKLLKELGSTMRELAIGETAVYPFQHEGHWMLVTIKKTNQDDFQLSGLSTSKHMPKLALGFIETQKYEKALKEAMSIIKQQVPKAHFSEDNILCGQVQNVIGSSCGGYIYDIAERMSRNGGNEVSAFNELANEVKDLTTHARQEYEVNTLRHNLVLQQDYSIIGE
ncbi:hypothetical protein [Shewanella surugensis]|uniref:Uncharacterized protein n=1 Tax=Shewanella surugensis TaxID=212020 RepID=A0ABT0LFE8_9GAMM|nr:hypothetical protein [Shewanella surugensis]MCL1126070.1 hypothetical protein [Shewanella surugensis]